MIETLITVLVVPLVRKLGQKWEDRIVEGVDKVTVDFFRKAVNSEPGAEKSLVAHLKAHPEQAQQLETRVLSTITSDESVAALQVTVLPKKGTKLHYYQGVVDWLLHQSEKLGRDIALKGFFNDPMALTIIGIRPSLSPKIEMLDDRIRLKAGANALVFEGANEQQLEDLFITTNDELKMSPSGRLKRDTEVKFYKVDDIFENWVHYERLNETDCVGFKDDSFMRAVRNMPHDFTELPVPLQERVRIQNYDGLKAMIDSVFRLAKEENEDIAALDEAFQRSFSQKAGR